LFAYQQGAGDYEAAVQTGLRLLALDALQEPVHRAVMSLYAGLGRRQAALRQYQLCVDTLKRELNAPPEAETTHLYQQIFKTPRVHPGRGEAPRPASGAAALPATPPMNLSASSSELIDREAEMREVVDLVRQHRLVTLTGAGGIGKTRLGVEVARHLLADFID